LKYIFGLSTLVPGPRWASFVSAYSMNM